MLSPVSNRSRKKLFRSRKRSAVRLKMSTQSPVAVCEDERGN